MILQVYIMVPSIEISQNSQAKRWTKDDKHYNSKNGHIVVEEVTQLMNVIAYTIFHQTTKG